MRDLLSVCRYIAVANGTSLARSTIALRPYTGRWVIQQPSISGVDNQRIQEAPLAIYAAELVGLTLEVNDAKWHQLIDPDKFDLVISVDSAYYLTDHASLAQFKLLKPQAEIMAYYSTYEPTPATHSVMAVDEVITSRGVVSNPCGQLAPYRHPNIRL